MREVNWMNKKELLHTELVKLDVFSEHKNKTASQMAEILGEDVPFPMSLTIANYTMATFTGHFHLKIKLAEDNLIPCNVIAFVLAKSGAKKTSSMLKLEKSLKQGYDVIQNHRWGRLVCFVYHLLYVFLEVENRHILTSHV